MNRTPNQDGWKPEPHPCPTCGRITIFRRCDVCVAREVANATTQPLPPIAQAMQLNHEDEFARTLAAWRAEPERIPAVRYWSGTCLWCAREIREQSGADDTHRPPLARIQTCYRHRKALLAFARWLRRETFGDAADGQKGGAA